MAGTIDTGGTVITPDINLNDMQLIRKRLVLKTADEDLVGRDGNGVIDYTTDNGADQYINDGILMLSDMPESKWMFEARTRLEVLCIANQITIPLPGLKTAIGVWIKGADGHEHPVERNTQLEQETLEHHDHRHCTFYELNLNVSGNIDRAIQLNHAPEDAYTLVVIGEFIPLILDNTTFTTSFALQHYPIIVANAAAYQYETDRANQERMDHWYALIVRDLANAETKRIAARQKLHAKQIRMRG